MQTLEYRQGKILSGQPPREVEAFNLAASMTRLQENFKKEHEKYRRRAAKKNNDDDNAADEKDESMEEDVELVFASSSESDQDPFGLRDGIVSSDEEDEEKKEEAAILMPDNGTADSFERVQ